MATKISKGNVVKFKDKTGRSIGGTVVELMDENGISYAMINTILGDRIRKRTCDLSLVKREKRGRLSKDYLQNLQEELDGGKIKQEVPKQGIKELESKPEPKPYIPLEEYTKTADDKLTDVSDGIAERLNGIITELRSENEKLTRIINTEGMTIDRLNEKIENLNLTISNQQKELDGYRNAVPENNDNLKVTIKHLAECIGYCSLGDRPEAIDSLLKIILKLNNISNE